MENLAAGIIRISKLYDPFCGSGTILAEALLKFLIYLLVTIEEILVFFICLILILKYLI